MRKTILIAITLALAGCSGDYTEVIDGDELVDVDHEEGEAPAEWRPWDGPDVPVNFDREPEPPLPLPEGFVPPYEPPARDKGASTLFQGWSVRGHMQYQDGVGEYYRLSDHVACSPDEWWITDCIYYIDMCILTPQGVCDNEWHIQADDLWAPGDGSFRAGVCNAAFPWYPCLFPKVTRASGGHAFTFAVDLAACPTDDQARTWAIHEGIDEAFGIRAQNGGGGNARNMWLKAGVTWTRVSPNQSPTVVFRCGNRHGSQAEFEPVGIVLPFAAAPLNAADACDDWDGAGPRPPPAQLQVDMMYTYERAVITLDWNRMWSSASCTQNSVEGRRYVRNLAIHEIGHFFGFQHSRGYTNPGFDVMANSGELPAQCAYNATTNLAMHPYLREAIRVMDMRNYTGPHQFYDQDLSCFAPRD